jgi:hypothetical protein
VTGPILVVALPAAFLLFVLGLHLRENASWRRQTRRERIANLERGLGIGEWAGIESSDTYGDDTSRR